MLHMVLFIATRNAHKDAYNLHQCHAVLLPDDCFF